jgi:hypothetical protein
LIIVIALTLVLRKVILTEKMLYGSLIDILSNIPDFRDKHNNTVVVLVQAILYVAAFLMSVSPSFIRVISNEYGAPQHVLKNIFLTTLLFLPLQGFFNCLIFILHKVYNYRRVNKSATIRHVLWLLFFHSAHEPCFISRISILREQEEDDSFVDDENRKKKNVLEVMTNDEGCSETMKYRLLIMTNGLELSSNTGGGGEDESSSKADGTLAQIDNNSRFVHASSVSTGLSGLSFESAVVLSYPSASPFSVD